MNPARTPAPAASFKPEHFSVLPHHEDTHFGPLARRRLVHQALEAYLEPSSRPMILDVGCGTGSMITEMRGKGWTGIGVDSFIEGLLYSRARKVHAVAQARCDSLPFGARFDAVLLMDVLEHLDNEQATLEEVASVLKPRGLLIVTVPALPSLWNAMDIVSLHRRRYTRRSLVDALTRSGYELLRCDYYMTLSLPFYAARILVEKLLPAPHTERSLEEVLKMPAWINSALVHLNNFERWLMRYASLPIGPSLRAICRKP